MAFKKIFSLILIVQFSLINLAQAGDFGWLEKLAIDAKVDASGIKTKLAARFNLGNVKVDTVLNNVDNVEDAYMVMRLGEMSGHDTEAVLEQYQANKGKGWGRLAKRLGIKPGSREFHNLKNAHARHTAGNEKNNSMREKGKSRGQGQGQGKNKGQGKGKRDY